MKQDHQILFSGIFNNHKVMIIFLVSFLTPLGIIGIVPDIPKITQELQIPRLLQLI